MTSNGNKSQGKGSGCFSGIARLLLCKGSLQTHPTDQITEPNSTPIQSDPLNKDSIDIQVVVNVKVEEAPPAATTTTTADGGGATPAAATSPTGVVARLMGLDSLPKTNWVLKGEGTAQDLATRSRSVNFMDYIVEFDLPIDEDEQQLRRVRTSVSFREVPTTMSNQRSSSNNNRNHDFLVLYLEEKNADSSDKKTGFKLRKCEVGFEDIKQTKEEKTKNRESSSRIPEGSVLLRMEMNEQELKDEPKAVSDKQFSKFGSCKISSGFVSPWNNNKERNSNSKAISPEKPMNQKEALVESKFMKKIKNQQAIKDVQSESGSEESSPISVLDLDEFMQDDMPFSENKHSSRTTNFDYSSIARSTRLSIDLEPKELKKKDHRQKQSRRDSKHNLQIVKKLCTLIEEEIKETKWIAKEVCDYESVEEICSEFGQEILDVLVKQVVEELVGFHLKSFIDGKVF